GGEITEADVRAHGGGGAAARAGPDRRALEIEQRVALAGDPAPAHLEADELAREAGRLDGDEGLLADEVALVELHRPAEPRLERVRGLVDVVAVERQPRLEPERVARGEPGGLQAVVATGLEEGAPERRGVGRGAEDL